MRGIVIAGGTMQNPAFYKSLVEQNDLIVCADSGYLNCRAMGAVPDLVIGDFDSCNADCVPSEVPVRCLPAEKDETDLHACLLHIISRGVKEIMVFGARGTRLDHSIAAVSLVYMGLEQGVRIRLIDEHNELFMFTGSVSVPRRPGYKLSLLPLTPVSGIYTKGLYYPVSGGTMCWGNPYGVSNEFTADTAEITMASGVMMVILSRD